MRRTSWFALPVVAGATLAGCASDYGRYGHADWYGPGRTYEGYEYRGGDYGYGPPPSGVFFRGEGADVLDPWLAFTPEGRDIVSRGFRGNDGWISLDAAHRANIWFRRYADTNDDMALTDPEIRVALVQAARATDDRRY